MPANTHIQVRMIGLESLNQAFNLLWRFFHEEGFTTPPEMKTYLEAMIRGQASSVFLAYLDDQALGVATVNTSTSLEHGLSAEMEDLYVLPQWRGRGIASALIDAVCAWCTTQGCTTLEVCVTPEGQDRHDLISFYQQRRFSNTGRLILEHKL